MADLGTIHEPWAANTPPRRFKRERTPGWKKPAGSRCVTRPGYLGNPFDYVELMYEGRSERQARADATRMYAKWLDGRLDRPDLEARRQRVLAEIPRLAGLHLGCYCPLPANGEEDHCHAAVLLQLANATGGLR